MVSEVSSSKLHSFETSKPISTPKPKNSLNADRLVFQPSSSQEKGYFAKLIDKIVAAFWQFISCFFCQKSKAETKSEIEKSAEKSNTSQSAAKADSSQAKSIEKPVPMKSGKTAGEEQGSKAKGTAFPNYKVTALIDSKEASAALLKDFENIRQKSLPASTVLSSPKASPRKDAPVSTTAPISQASVREPSQPENKRSAIAVSTAKPLSSPKPVETILPARTSTVAVPDAVREPAKSAVNLSTVAVPTPSAPSNPVSIKPLETILPAKTSTVAVCEPAQSAVNLSTVQAPTPSAPSNPVSIKPQENKSTPTRGPNRFESFLFMKPQPFEKHFAESSISAVVEILGAYGNITTTDEELKKNPLMAKTITKVDFSEGSFTILNELNTLFDKLVLAIGKRMDQILKTVDRFSSDQDFLEMHDKISNMGNHYHRYFDEMAKSLSAIRDNNDQSVSVPTSDLTSFIEKVERKRNAAGNIHSGLAKEFYPPKN